MAGTVPRVVIVGAGPAGLRAASVLAGAGIRPTLIDEAPRIGGQIYRQPPTTPGFVRSRRELYGAGASRATALFDEFDRNRHGIDHLPGWLAFDVMDRRIRATDGRHTRTFDWDALVLATGATDRVIPCPGWTSPGVYSLGGAQIALKYQGCAIGRRVVFAGTGPLLFLAAHQYARAGAPPAAVLVPSPFSRLASAAPRLLGNPAALQRGMRWLAGLRRMGVAILFGHRLARILGGERVAAVDAIGPDGNPRRIACDAVALGYGLRPETQLADLAGADFGYDPATRLHLPRCDAVGRAIGAAGLYLAGDGLAALGADAAEAAGRRAAFAVLEDLDRPAKDDARASDLKLLAKWRDFQSAMRQALPYPDDLASSVPDDCVVCRCELVLAGDLRGAAGVMGAEDINRIKAFTRLGMGRCQGRMCAHAAAEILAAKLGVALPAIGRLRGQPPVKPVMVGAMAVGEAGG